MMSKLSWKLSAGSTLDGVIFPAKNGLTPREPDVCYAHRKTGLVLLFGKPLNWRGPPVRTRRLRKPLGANDNIEANNAIQKTTSKLL